jgi:hypothetical protein
MWEETGIRIDLHDCKIKTDAKIIADRIIFFMVKTFQDILPVRTKKYTKTVTVLV